MVQSRASVQIMERGEILLVDDITHNASLAWRTASYSASREWKTDWHPADTEWRARQE